MPKLAFYLSNWNHHLVTEGKHRFLCGLVTRFRELDFDVELIQIEPEHRYTAGLFEDYAILDKMLVGRKNVVTIRRAIYPPFWTIEQAEYRRDFRMTKRRFPKNKLTAQDKAQDVKKFITDLRKRRKITKIASDERGQAAYIALQGRLLDQRFGQVMTPLEMIEAVRENEADRQILIGLHPKANYSDEERDALYALCQDIDATISDQTPPELMRMSSYIVSMNSSVAFEAMIYGLPSLLFADADFHHLLNSVTKYPDLASAFEAVRNNNTDFDPYIYWYLRNNMINASWGNAINRSMRIIGKFGWPVS